MNPTPYLAPSANVSVSMVDLLASLVIAMVLGLWAVYVYRVTHRGLTYERSFLVTMAMIGPIVGVVIILIGSNLALSLGLVGALSIIRFRNVIKDTRDMVFLFWAIAIGLGVGTFSWMIAVTSSLFLGVALIGFHLLRYGEAQHEEFVCVVTGDGHELSPQINSVIESIVDTYLVRSLQVDENGTEIVYELKMARDNGKSARNS